MELSFKELYDLYDSGSFEAKDAIYCWLDLLEHKKGNTIICARLHENGRITVGLELEGD